MKYQQKQMTNQSNQKHTIQSNMRYCKQSQHIFNDFDGLAGPALGLGLGLGAAGLGGPRLGWHGWGLAGLGVGQHRCFIRKSIRFYLKTKDWLTGAAWAGWAGFGWLGLAPENNPNAIVAIST